MKVKVMDVCGEEVLERETDELREEIKIRLLYAIPRLVDATDVERATESLLALFHKDCPADHERWKPESDYWWIMGDGSICRDVWDGGNTAQTLFAFGNVFRTKQEAEHAREKLKAVLVTLHQSDVNARVVAKPKGIVS
jgi:hypothetical protein